MKITRTSRLLLALLLIPLLSFCHTVEYDFSKMSTTGIFWEYFKLGVTHIVPLGYDHILFVIGLFLLNPKVKIILMQVTAFTIAHSITLALAMTGKIHPNPGFIEPFIAISIVFVGIENLINTEIRWWRLVVVFLFGLVHGCGFAGVLSEIGLPENTFVPALISFNLGVEIGQTIVILASILIFQSWKSREPWYRNRITIPVSAAISALAFYWTIERILA